MLPLLAAYMGASALGSMGSGHGLAQTPLIGGMFSDPAQEKLENQMRQNSAYWEAQKPVIAESANRIMGHVNNAYAPANMALSQMYDGQPVPGPTPDVSGATAPANLPNPGAPSPVMPPGRQYMTSGGPVTAMNDRAVPGPRDLPGFSGRPR
jgi:hypothetical protein